MCACTWALSEAPSDPLKAWYSPKKASKAALRSARFWLSRALPNAWLSIRTAPVDRVTIGQGMSLSAICPRIWVEESSMVEAAASTPSASSPRVWGAALRILSS